MTMANHPAKNTSNVKRVKSVRKRSRMVQRSKIRISDQDEVSLKMNEKDMFKHVTCLFITQLDDQTSDVMFSLE